MSLPFNQAESAQRAANVERSAGDLGRAETELRRGYAILDAVGERNYLLGFAADLAIVLCQMGRYEEAAGFVQVASEALPGDLVVQSLRRMAEAMIRSAEGRHAEAVALATESADLMPEVDLIIEGDLHLRLAEVLLDAGLHADAEAAATEALGLCELKGNTVFAAEVHRFLATLHGRRE